MSQKPAKSKVDLEEAVRDLNPDQLSRFELLFKQKKNNGWLLPTALTALAAYALAAGILIHPGYSWMVALIPTLFVVFFIRSLLKGVVGVGQDRQKDYGSIILPIVLISLFGLCGVLIWARNNNAQEQQSYLKSYQMCQQNPDGTVVDSGYYYSYYDRDCDRILDESRHQARVKNYESNNDQWTRGVIVTGLGLLIIYPLGLYYSKSLIDKKNSLLAKSLADRIKEG